MPKLVFLCSESMWTCLFSLGLKQNEATQRETGPCETDAFEAGLRGCHQESEPQDGETRKCERRESFDFADDSESQKLWLSGPHHNLFVCLLYRCVMFGNPVRHGQPSPRQNDKERYKLKKTHFSVARFWCGFSPQTCCKQMDFPLNLKRLDLAQGGRGT